jgi:hypothetical protein
MLLCKTINSACDLANTVEKYCFYFILSNFLLIAMKAVPRIGILTIRSNVSTGLVVDLGN